jgi:hypothetical protein
MITSYLDLIYIFSFKEKANCKFYIDNLFSLPGKDSTIIFSKQLFAGKQCLGFHEIL